ncbi:MAG: toxin-antitoxin system HicB family antitoxin [Verrucomicrobiota bacterium]
MPVPVTGMRSASRPEHECERRPTLMGANRRCRPASAPQSQINNHPARRRQGSTSEYDDVFVRPNSGILIPRQAVEAIIGRIAQISHKSLRLPDSLHRKLKQAADADGISINHFVSLAVAEKLSAIQTIDILSERAKGASRSVFLHAMSLVPRGEIIEGDEPRPKKGRTRRPTE